jgi:ADP-ribosylglycohydrolase
MRSNPPVSDHNARLERARLSLEGLSLGDAFGETFFARPGVGRTLARPPWRYTDDTEMALAIVEVVERYRTIHQEELARAFARRYQADPHRGYSPSTGRLLARIAEGDDWTQVAGEVFGGLGSFGNGGAMRVAPLGAYFADDYLEVVEEARSSAEVTHAHPEGQAGAIATAVAAAWAWNNRNQPAPRSGREMLQIAWKHTPAGQTRDGLATALDLGFDRSVAEAVRVLGNGRRVTSQDTVPFALWCAGRHIDDTIEALWATVSAGGDSDTNCAIVGGIVVLANGLDAIPAEWLTAREPLAPFS